MTVPCDYYIGGLGFNKKVTTDTPEERATAQFRKDQFDSQATVGDQSLTGWWTRGQLSFHKGAGITYYEVQEGDSVLNRFKDCDDVEVFEPGEVTLTKSRSSLSLDAIDAVPGPLSQGGGVYALTSTGVEYTAGTGSTPIDTSDSGVPTAITSSGSLYYVANGTLIERQYAAADARVSYVTNPSFEVDLSDWTFDDSVGSVFFSAVRSSDYSKYGGYGCIIRDAIGNSADRWGETALTGLTISNTYIASAWVYMAQTTGQITMTVAAGTISTTTPFGWVNLRVPFVASATSHTLRIKCAATGGGSTPNFVIDAIMVTESPYPGDYFDGSYPGCSWAGTPNLSKSNFVTASDGDSIPVITSTDGSWDGVWWAKGRLFLVDDSNHWYALADDTASVDNTDSFWSSTNQTPTWSLADSPGPVYISDGSDIFAITIDTDGLVPSIGTPTTVARLPLGETVVDLAYYLSNLVVVTTKGVRVAVVQADKIYLGPLTIEGDFTNSVRGGAFDTVVHVVGRLSGRHGDPVMCALDLSSANDDLTYPWAPIATLATDSSTADGCVVDPAGRIFAWSAGDMVVTSADELTEDGSLTTGYHRFGTLDGKFFASVSVRLKGTGEVEVFRVDGDGVETSLGTLDAADGVGELTLTGDPVERIALRFALSRNAEDSTKGPTLLGYQLKALPIPKRQRMIRVPLTLHDYEVDGSGQKRGEKGGAWSRLAVLEALEESNAVVDFEDRETSETGSAYIESLEVRRTAPTSRLKDGFGGLLYVTLRKLT